jgi:LysM repeat protein
MHPHEEEYDDYGPEPNMKLSHAFMVVLLLHVVAVGGLYAFNSMKASKAPKIAAAKASASADQAEPVARETESGSRNQGAPEPQNQQPDNGGQKPSEEKAPLVAKGAEAPKANDKGAIREPSESPVPAQKGWLASMRGAVEKVAGVGSVAAGAGHAMAQEASNAQTQVATTVTAATDSAKTYLVKAGDTITRIASSLGVTIPDLEKANGLAQNSVLQVGQILKVPAQVIAQGAADVSSQAAKTVAGGSQLTSNAPASVATAGNATQETPVATQSATIVTEYTVVKGDNPYKIAKKFKITPDELMKANGIADPKKIQIGQVLKIPASSKKSSKSVKSAQ